MKGRDKTPDNPQVIHLGWIKTVTEGGKIASPLFNSVIDLCREEDWPPKIITIPYQLLSQPFSLNGTQQ